MSDYDVREVSCILSFDRSTSIGSRSFRKNALGDWSSVRLSVMELEITSEV